MAPVIPDPKSIRAFKSADALESWLAKNHGKQSELYLRIYKKGSGVATVSHSEAVDVALCWGWIDAIRKSHDELSFLQRFTPRKPRSIWSQVNRERVERLVASGRMTPHGLAQVEAAKADGRWAAAYGVRAKMKTPDDLLAALQREPEALATYEQLDKTNLFALAFRLGNLKTAAGREKRIASFVAMLKQGRTLHPQRSSKRKSKP